MRKSIIVGLILMFALGCAAIKRPKSYYWVEAFQNGKQIGIWKTAPGSKVVKDFDIYRFKAEDGSIVELQGPSIVVVVHEVKPEQQPAEAQPAPPAAEPAK